MRASGLLFQTLVVVGALAGCVVLVLAAPYLLTTIWVILKFALIVLCFVMICVYPPVAIALLCVVALVYVMF